MKNQTVANFKILTAAIDNYLTLSKDDNLDLVDEANLCFEIMDKYFKWNLDQEENVKSMQYILKATDNECAKYLKEEILPIIEKKIVKLNAYGNEFGFHNPQQSLKYINQIRDAVLGSAEFDDCSWHEDMCDSCADEVNDIIIYFPNPDIKDERFKEGNSKFHFTVNTIKGQEDEQKFITLDTIEEVVEKVVLFVLHPEETI